MKFKDYNRRAFIRGTGGVLVALPFAQFASNGEQLIGAPAGAAPTRLFTVSYGTGVDPARFSYADHLASFKDLKDQMIVIKNLKHTTVESARSRGLNAHVAGGANAFTLTGSKSSDGSNAENKEIATSASIDQIAMSSLPKGSKMPVIQAGYCGYADNEARWGKYMNYRSIDASGAPIADIQHDPYKLFTSLFGSGVVATNDTAAMAAQVRRQSILDGAANQIRELNSDRYGLSAESKMQLDAHLTKIREMEMASAGSPTMSACKVPTNKLTKAQGDQMAKDSNGLKNHMNLIGDLMVTALQCDLVRFGNICVGEAAFHCRIKELLTADPTTDGHEAAHSANLVPIWNAHARYYLDIIAAMMMKMKAASDVDGKSLLDSTIFYVATELSDHSAGHSFKNMSAMVIGRKAQGVPGEIDAKQAPIIDALAGVLNAAGVPADKYTASGAKKLF